MKTRTAVPEKRSARERLLVAAQELFYEEGVNTVGIDRVIERAGVAKASLYDCFGSKEELIRAYLQGRHEARQARLAKGLERFTTPRDKLLGVFELLASSSTIRNIAAVPSSARVRRRSRAAPSGRSATSHAPGCAINSRNWLRMRVRKIRRARRSADAAL